MLLTIYSSVLLLRLYQAVPNTVLFGDIGEAAAGPWVSARACSAAPCMRASAGRSILHTWLLAPPSMSTEAD